MRRRGYSLFNEANNPGANDMTNLNQVAAALLALKVEMRDCPRNKSGKVNGNARGARVDRCVKALMEAGETRYDAYAMAFQAANS